MNKIVKRFTCSGCGCEATRIASSAWIAQRMIYCSKGCKAKTLHKAWVDKQKVNPQATSRCPKCGLVTAGYRPITCDSCKKMAKASKALKPKNIQRRSCLICAESFLVRPTSTQMTCSRACRAKRLSLQLRGKKYQRLPAQECICQRCEQPFLSHQKGRLKCSRCVKAMSPSRCHGKHERRAKRAGVPYVYGIKPHAVFERDAWRCQLCGCKTPKRLRGRMVDRAPELDHIIPLSKGGGHVWVNLQCVCRKCNMKKNDKPLGQLRLAV